MTVNLDEDALFAAASWREFTARAKAGTLAA